MNKYIMKLPQLNLLTPDVNTTFKKLVEEISECNEAFETLSKFEEKYNINWLLLSDDELNRIRSDYKKLINEFLFEIMDIAQVCVSQLFVFETNGMDTKSVFDDYIEEDDEIIFEYKNNCKYFHLPRRTKDTSISETMNSIIKSMGIIAKLSKFTGENGEKPIMDINASNYKYVYELYNIIQYCFDLIYIMNEKYNIDIKMLFDGHVNKLIKKGYVKLD
ncbi:hypothetical protein [Alkaliphilus sp. B6464]|uniref:hypothetical protein n=1 Tax=Alkaliphilus sp. B6464 TaxID=2731219 RepID=UPI001BA5F6B5|nr:hypothetical protein [Alkaliphilus sp. B6464]QUH21847.1 hypothetical protein HYG84_18090 [Alkaliphilus sp. B6464]